MSFIIFTIKGKPIPQPRHKHSTFKVAKDKKVSGIGAIINSYSESDDLFAKSIEINTLDVPKIIEDVITWFDENKGRPHSYDPSEDKKKSFLSECMPYKPDTPLNGPLAMDIACWFKRPQGHYGTRKGVSYLKDDYKDLKWYDKTPDIDNLRKFVMDSLNEVFYADDKQIVTGTTSKYYTGIGEEPRTEIKIYNI